MLQDALISTRIGVGQAMQFSPPPPRTQPKWVSEAKSRIVLQSTGDWLMSMLPDDPENTILKRLKRTKPEDGEPQDAPPERRGSLGGPARETADYGSSDRTAMQRLIQGNPAAR